jgi:hypothetical protein
MRIPDIDNVRGWRCRTMVDRIGDIEKNYANDRSGAAGCGCERA